MAFECRLLGVVRLSIIGRFVFLESAIFRRFVWDFSEIWICGLYIDLCEQLQQVLDIKERTAKSYIRFMREREIILKDPANQSYFMIGLI